MGVDRKLFKTPSAKTERAARDADASSPGSSSGGGGPEIRRSSSALARFTRSVTKLRSSHRRRGSELPPLPPEEIDEPDEGSEAVKPREQAMLMRRAETMPAGVIALQRTGGGGGAAAVTATPAAADPAAFLRAVPDLMGVDSTLASVAAALRSAEGLARSLWEVAGPEAAAAAPTTEPPTPLALEPVSASDRAWDRVEDALEAAVAECRFEDAAARWRELSAAADDAAAAAAGAAGPAAAQHAWALQHRADEAGARLAEALLRDMALPDPGYSPGLRRQRSAAALLAGVAGTYAALIVLLDVAAVRLRDALEALPPAHQRSDEATVDLAAAMGQTLARGLAGAVEAIEAAFGPAQVATPPMQGALGQWAMVQTTAAAEALRRGVLLPRAAPAGLPVAARCVTAFVSHCDAVEGAVGVPVGATAREAAWQGLAPVLQRRTRQLCEGLRKAAVSEARATASGKGVIPSPPSAAEWDALAAAFPSARRLLSEISTTAAALAPLAGPSAVAAARSAFGEAFATYAQSLAAALAGETGPGAGAAAEAAMEVATRLVEQRLAEAAAPLTAAGWGPGVDATAAVAAVEAAGAALGMDTVPLSPQPALCSLQTLDPRLDVTMLVFFLLSHRYF